MVLDQLKGWLDPHPLYSGAFVSSSPVAVISQCSWAGTVSVVLRCCSRRSRQQFLPGRACTANESDAGCGMGPGAGTCREAQDGNTLLGDRGSWDAHPAQLSSSLLPVAFSRVVELSYQHGTTCDVCTVTISQIV